MSKQVKAETDKIQKYKKARQAKIKTGKNQKCEKLKQAKTQIGLVSLLPPVLWLLYAGSGMNCFRSGHRSFFFAFLFRKE